MSNVTPYTFDRFVENFWNTTAPTFGTYTISGGGTYSQDSTPDEYIIEAPLVGISREKLKVQVEDNVLVVSAEANKKTTFVKNFKHSWILPKDCSVEQIIATLENGLLTIRIPKNKPARRTVNINVV